MFKKMSVICLSIVISGNVFADINKGVYIGVGSGMTENQAQTYQATAGYMFSNWYGAELNYVYINNYQLASNNQNINSTAINGLFVLNQQLGSSPVNIHEKAGISYINMNLPNNYQNGSGFTSLLSGGVGLYLGKSMEIAVDYTYYGLVQPINYISTINNQTNNFQPQTYQINLNYYF